MDQKKNRKRMIALACTALIVILLAAMPLLAKQTTQEDGPVASILSGDVSTGSIHRELLGGGTLKEEDAVKVSVPAAVKLTKFLVSNGDWVTEGSPVAAVDRVTVMTAISQVQETLEYLSKEIENAADMGGTKNVTAPAGGTVKLLYAEAGASVRDVMLEHGALAVLSLDGLMAVDIIADSNLSVGSAVAVSFSDGTAVSGKVVKNLAGKMTVTMEDNGYAVDDVVQVAAEDGTPIGSGKLYIYSPWNATAYTGTVNRIHVTVGSKLNPGNTLMVLENVEDSASYRQLIAQRKEYENLMLDLFQMYQTETITAPCDGIASGIDRESLQLLSDSGEGYVLTFLANAPNGDDETLYSNYVVKISAVADNGWVLNVNPEPVPVEDYLDLSGINPDTALMTHTVLYTRIDLPLFTWAEEAWISVDPGTIGSGDLLLFAADSQGSPVWAVLIQKGAPQPENPGMGGFPSGGMSGGYPYGGMAVQEPKFELYSIQMTDIAAVTPQNTMTLEISVDELDILSLKLGMTAQVKIDALGGKKYTATITDIGNTGRGNGGSSKYTVELTMDRAENMLGNMNATASILLSSVENVLTVPAKALAEQGNQTVVYTGYDAETETLINPITVKIGASDGESVEILEGLTEGQTYFYAYYDTLEISYTPDFGGLFG